MLSKNVFWESLLLIWLKSLWLLVLVVGIMENGNGRWEWGLEGKCLIGKLICGNILLPCFMIFFLMKIPMIGWFGSHFHRANSLVSHTRKNRFRQSSLFLSRSLCGKSRHHTKSNLLCGYFYEAGFLLFMINYVVKIKLDLGSWQHLSIVWKPRRRSISPLPTLSSCHQFVLSSCSVVGCLSRLSSRGGWAFWVLVSFGSSSSMHSCLTIGFLCYDLSYLELA